MARYMMTSPAFLSDGVYYDATLEKPMIVNLPDDSAPSLTWVPLDAAAQAALAKLVAEKIEVAIASGTPKAMADRQFRAKPIPGGAKESEALPAVAVTPLAKPDPDAVDRSAFDRIAQSQKPKTAEVTLQVPKGRRPSDQEPK